MILECLVGVAAGLILGILAVGLYFADRDP